MKAVVREASTLQSHSYSMMLQVTNDINDGGSTKSENESVHNLSKLSWALSTGCLAIYQRRQNNSWQSKWASAVNYQQRVKRIIRKVHALYLTHTKWGAKVRKTLQIAPLPRNTHNIKTVWLMKINAIREKVWVNEWRVQAKKITARRQYQEYCTDCIDWA